MKIIKTQKGSLSLLGGKTDMGKSTVACYDCAESLKQGKGVAFFSFEYCQSVIYNKLVSHFGMKFQDLFKLNVLDASLMDFEAVKKLIKSMKGTVDTVYIDYLDLMAKKTDYNYADFSNIQKLELKQRMLQELAQLSFDLQIEIIVLARVHASLDLDNTIDYLNMLTSTSHSPAPVVKMFLAKDELINPILKASNMSSVIIIDDNNELVLFSSMNLKQIYQG